MDRRGCLKVVVVVDCVDIVSAFNLLSSLPTSPSSSPSTIRQERLATANPKGIGSTTYRHQILHGHHVGRVDWTSVHRGNGVDVQRMSV